MDPQILGSSPGASRVRWRAPTLGSVDRKAVCFSSFYSLIEVAGNWTYEPSLFGTGRYLHGVILPRGSGLHRPQQLFSTGLDI